MEKKIINAEKYPSEKTRIWGIERIEKKSKINQFSTFVSSFFYPLMIKK